MFKLDLHFAELIFFVVVPILLVITLVMVIHIRSSCLEIQQHLTEIKNKLNRIDDLQLDAILKKLNEPTK